MPNQNPDQTRLGHCRPKDDTAKELPAEGHCYQSKGFAPDTPGTRTTAFCFQVQVVLRSQSVFHPHETEFRIDLKPA